MPPTGRRTPALRIDHADDVTIDGLRVRGFVEAVRVRNARNARLAHVAVDDVGAGVRFRRVAGATLAACTVRRTSGGPGLRVDVSRDVAVTDLVVEDSPREGVLVRRSTGVSLVDACVVGARGRSGIAILASPDVRLSGSEARGNARDGVRVERSAGIALERTRAEGNGDTGLRVTGSRPFWVVDDLVVRGNRARANARYDMVVKPPRCGRRPCPRPPTPPTSTTVTTTTVPTTVPAPVVTTTTAPSTQFWRFYVQLTDEAGRHRGVNVPFRSSEPPLAVTIRPSDVRAFRVGDQVTESEIEALGGDTLTRLHDAATAYVLSHPTDYKGATPDVALQWVKRDP